MKDQCDFPAFTAYRLGDDMVHIEMKKVKELTGADVEQIYSCHKKIGEGRKVYVLVTFAGYIPMSDDAMAQAKKSESVNLQGATAYVINSFAMRIGAKFFMNFHKPKYPTNIFSKKDGAIAWLKQVKEANQKKLAELV